MKHKPDTNTIKIRNWIAAQSKVKSKLLRSFLKNQDFGSHGITHILHGKDFGKLRKQIVINFNIQ